LLVEPTLVFDADIDATNDRRYAGDKSLCCGDSIDADGRCEKCELVAAEPVPYRCSDCRAPVINFTPREQALLECPKCGARWGDLGDKSASSITINALHANAWNPAKAPVRYTEYLNVYFGYKPDVATPTSFPIALRGLDEGDIVEDDWDGLS
jgi:DNA-directed RNA polymerase subunit RPC12/RpoP